ncbi:unnamed protein product [Phytophthora fragariaefolia]|uniref:Unnamed protein product n=1 Tax=Phytophthora fragariaefolia TaxID=1490495 RepID=A0A9W6Y8Y4_9STRA|nr:unnamed protein product [Phytophthora fragariaefolia]
MTRIERSYSIKKKREALALTSQVGIKTASQSLSIPRGTLYDWTKQAEAIYGFQGNDMSRSLKGQGWKEIFPAVSDVLTYMKDVRLEQSWAGRGRKDPVRILGANKHAGRMTAVLTIRDDGKRYQFDVRVQPAASCAGLGAVMPANVSVRCTGLPGRAAEWAAYAGGCGGRMGAISGGGWSVPGDRLEQGELEEYPDGHFYSVQEKAWMDSTVWKVYVENLLKFEIDAPAVLLLDNFECHVSEEGQRLVAEEANATVVPLHPNSSAA